MSSHHADRLLTNCRVLTMDPAAPRASAIAVKGDRILWVGDGREARRLRGPGTRVLDCRGHVLIPGFIDAHLHLFALAANLVSVDCSPRAVRSIADIGQALARRAAKQLPGTWVRGWGYNDFYLAERRHPTRWDLDRAAPQHPVRLVHRSGHISVLNSMAMDRLGVSSQTPEAPGGVIERALPSGEPSGVLVEMEDELAGRGASSVSADELLQGLALAFQRLLSLGITSVHEATPVGALGQWEMLQRLRDAGRLPVRVHKMVGPGDLEGLRKRDLFFGAGDAGLSVGAVKVMLNETGDRVLPERQELRERVYAAHRAGYQVAFHAVEEAGIVAARDAVEQAVRRSMEDAPDIAGLGLRVHDHRHRIEHCGVCPPELGQRLGALGMLVVTQPGFIAEHGERYLREVPRDQRRWLYRAAGLRRAGVRVAFGSDCPFGPLEPFVGIQAAVTRRTGQGEELGVEEAVAAEEALAMSTAAPAYASSDEHDRGVIAAGKLADLALLDRDPTAVEPDALAGTRVLWTMVGGEVAWEQG